MLLMRTAVALLLTVTFSVRAFASEGMNISTQMLDNGLEVIVVENHTVPLVTIEICVKNGAYTESPEYDGLSHLYEHMFFKANEVIPSQPDFLERLRELGASWNGTTSEERVNYFFTMGVDSLEQGLVFMRDAIMYPVFEQKELENERPVVTGEYDRAESRPFFHLFQAVGKKLWYKYWSRKNVIGDREVILTATTEKMLTVKNKYYIPNNSALLVSGDVSMEEVLPLIQKIFAKWERGLQPHEKYPVPEHPPLTKNEKVIVEKPFQVVGYQVAYHGPSVKLDPKATYAADVFSFILGQSNSKFMKALHESGLWLNIGLSYYTLSYTGPITITGTTTPQKFREAEEALFAEIAKFNEPDYFTDEQMEYAKNQLEVLEIYSREQASTWVHTVSFWWAVSGGMDYYRNYVSDLRTVSREDISKYVTDYILDRYHVTGVLIAPESREEIGLIEEDLK